MTEKTEKVQKLFVPKTPAETHVGAVGVWDKVKAGCEEIREMFPYLPWRSEDVYSALRNNTALLYTSPDGFAVCTIEMHPISGERTFHCWIAYAYQRNLDMVGAHFDFFLSEAKRLECQKFGAKTPIKALGKKFEELNMNCDMIDYSIEV